MKKILLILHLLIFVIMTPVFPQTVELATPSVKTKEQKSLDFFVEQAREADNRYVYNRYEDIISGVAAFVIGNVGYYFSNSGSLQLSYAAVQTIGIINIGQGIYKLKSPTIKTSLSRLLTDPKKKTYSKDALARELLEIYADDDRAKRLSIFYGSSFLALQYLLNATVYDSVGKIKNVYYFLGGVNVIIAAYSGMFKSDYEKRFYGDDLDVSPFVYRLNDQDHLGALISLSF